MNRISARYQAPCWVSEEQQKSRQDPWPYKADILAEETYNKVNQ